VNMECAWTQFKNEWRSVSRRHNASMHMKEAIGYKELCFIILTLSQFGFVSHKKLEQNNKL
jgi:hypothetical protein